jgi:hypothetical protein
MPSPSSSASTLKLSASSCSLLRTCPRQQGTERGAPCPSVRRGQLARCARAHQRIAPGCAARRRRSPLAAGTTPGGRRSVRWQHWQRRRRGHWWQRLRPAAGWKQRPAQLLPGQARAAARLQAAGNAPALVPRGPAPSPAARPHLLLLAGPLQALLALRPGLPPLPARPAACALCWAWGWGWGCGRGWGCGWARGWAPAPAPMALGHPLLAAWCRLGCTAAARRCSAGGGCRHLRPAAWQPRC